MLRLRVVRFCLLPASFLIFLTGVFVSAEVFYQGKQFDAKSAILSDLQSPDDNPHGYLFAATGTAMAAIVLVPVGISFYVHLRKLRPKLALAGIAAFAVGLAAAVCIGILAPWTHGYTITHVQLASATFIGISTATLFNLLAARAAPALVIFQFATIVLIVFLCYGPVQFDNDRLLTSLAFWEWVLCIDCGAVLWALSGAIRDGRGPNTLDS